MEYQPKQIYDSHTNLRVRMHMDPIVLEGSPLADYFKELNIHEETLPILTPQTSFESQVFTSERQGHTDTTQAFFSPKKWHRWRPFLLLLTSFRMALVKYVFKVLPTILSASLKIICRVLNLTIQKTRRVFSQVLLLLHKGVGDVVLSSAFDSHEETQLILKEWHKVSKLLLWRWNYLREMESLHRGYSLRTDAVPSLSHFQDTFSQTPLRQHLIDQLTSLLTVVVSACAGPSVSISGPESRVMVQSCTAVDRTLQWSLQELRYAINTLRELVPLCPLHTLQQLRPLLDHTRLALQHTDPFAMTTRSTSHPLTPLSNRLYTLHMQLHALLAENSNTRAWLATFHSEWETVRRMYEEVLNDPTANCTDPCHTLVVPKKHPRDTEAILNAPPPHHVPTTDREEGGEGHLALKAAKINTNSYMLEATLSHVSTPVRRSGIRKRPSTPASDSSVATIVLLDELKNVLNARNASAAP